MEDWLGIDEAHDLYDIDKERFLELFSAGKIAHVYLPREGKTEFFVSRSSMASHFAPRPRSKWKPVVEAVATAVAAGVIVQATNASPEVERRTTSATAFVRRLSRLTSSLAERPGVMMWRAFPKYVSLRWPIDVPHSHKDGVQHLTVRELGLRLYEFCNRADRSMLPYVYADSDATEGVPSELLWIWLHEAELFQFDDSQSARAAKQFASFNQPVLATLAFEIAWG